MQEKFTAQKLKFSIKGFFSKCDQIWSHLVKNFLMENFIFYAVISPPRRVNYFNEIPP